MNTNAAIHSNYTDKDYMILVTIRANIIRTLRLDILNKFRKSFEGLAPRESQREHRLIAYWIEQCLSVFPELNALEMPIRQDTNQRRQILRDTYGMHFNHPTDDYFKRLQITKNYISDLQYKTNRNTALSQAIDSLKTVVNTLETIYTEITRPSAYSITSHERVLWV